MDGCELIEIDPKIKIQSYKTGGKNAPKGPKVAALFEKLQKQAQKPIQIISLEDRRITLKQGDRRIHCYNGGIATGNPFCGGHSYGSQCNYMF